MKNPIQTRPAVSTRSLLTLGLGCALAALPLAVASAQDSSSTAPRATGVADPTKSADERPKLNGDEQKFVKMAAAGNLAEIEAAELALKHAESAEVKDFAKMMITDHSEANKELMALAQRTNLEFKPMVMEKDKEEYKKLEALKGKAFDEEYVKNAVADHSKDLEDYKQAHNQVTSKDLLNYVNKTEAVIGHHYHMAKKLNKEETKG